METHAFGWMKLSVDEAFRRGLQYLCFYSGQCKIYRHFIFFSLLQLASYALTEPRLRQHDWSKNKHEAKEELYSYTQDRRIDAFIIKKTIVISPLLAIRYDGGAVAHLDLETLTHEEEDGRSQCSVVRAAQLHLQQVGQGDTQGPAHGRQQPQAPHTHAAGVLWTAQKQKQKHTHSHVENHRLCPP